MINTTWLTDLLWAIMAMSFLKFDFLTLALDNTGVLKHVWKNPTHICHRLPAHPPLNLKTTMG